MQDCNSAQRKDEMIGIPNVSEAQTSILRRRISVSDYT
jgi:hypothetical protein